MTEVYNITTGNRSLTDMDDTLLV